MDWLEFDQKITTKRLLLFTSEDVRRIFNVSKRAALKFLSKYERRGGLIRVKKGLYTLADHPVPNLYLANKLYEPSYVSLDIALSFHGVKPETVYGITSVTTRKTKTFEALGQEFIYRRIKKKAFTGYKAITYLGMIILMADPEKALVDSLYLKILSSKNLSDLAAKEFERLNLEKINKARALKYAKLFDDNRLILLLKEEFSHPTLNDYVG